MARPKKGLIQRIIDGSQGAPVGSEQGSTIDPERIFLGGQIGEVLGLADDPTPGNLESMIKHDGQARQLASALRLPVRGASWSIEKGPNDSGEAQFVRDVLIRPPYQGGMTTPFDQFLSQVAWAIVTRQAFFEKVWKRDEQGRFVYHKLAWRPPATCAVLADPKNGSFNGFVQRGIANNRYFEKVFDPRKSFVYIHGNDISPLLGSTAFETAYRDHLQKLKVKYLYYSFLENVAYPKLKATYTGSESGGLKSLVRKAASLSRGAVVGLGEREDVAVLESQRTSNEYINALAYLDSQMSKSTLSTFLDLGTQGDRGSYALSRDQSEFFLESLESILTEIAGSINQHLIPDLIFYNFGADASYPIFRFQPVNDQSKDIAMEVFKALAVAAQPNVGQNFYNELTVKAANILGLDNEKVIEDIPAVSQVREEDALEKEGVDPKEGGSGTKDKSPGGDEVRKPDGSNSSAMRKQTKLEGR